MSFGGKMPGDHKTIQALTRKNSLFLSTAAQNNHEALLTVYTWFSRLPAPIIERRGFPQDVVELCQNEQSKRTIVRLLSRADLGVPDVMVDELMGSPPVTDIRLAHRIDGAEIPLAMHQESNGTLAYLSLIGPIMWGLRNGAVLCVDELDASLHPLLGVEIVRLFNGPATNPQNAQLIFNTHDTNLLGSGELRRDQIWFTEKDSAGSSHLYPLTDFKPRRRENLGSGYLQGRYGAIPFIHSDFLAGNTGGNGEKS
ncbi:MAG: AAA family ATPase [Bryobacteraceae bacterium]